MDLAYNTYPQDNYAGSVFPSLDSDFEIPVDSSDKIELLINYKKIAEESKNNPNNKSLSIKRDNAFIKIMKLYDNLLYKLIILIGKRDNRITKDHINELRNGFWGIAANLLETKWDPKKGGFSTFIYPYMLHEITNYLNKNIYSSTKYQHNNERRFNAIAAELSKNGITPDVLSIAIAANCKVDTVINTISHPKKHKQIELDKEDENGNRFDIPSEFNVEQKVQKDIERDVLIKAIEKLPYKEKTVIKLHSSIFGKKMSYEEIYHYMGLSSLKEVTKLINNACALLRNDLDMKKEFSTKYSVKEKNTKNILMVEKAAGEMMTNDLTSYFSGKAQKVNVSEEEDVLLETNPQF